MSKDTERKTAMTALNAKIEELKARLVKIPDKIEQLEDARREILTKSVKKSKELHEAGDMKASKEATDLARAELRGVNQSIEDQHKEQARINAEIAKLEKEKAKLLT
ncbi:hypothetical protein KY333_00575 [Candidatus Woesearchaeota archaeon]|nr:hypothetical protein [Candidatus Woesearchaeota archaeon]MBW2994201.1 hypothetical protein [Candidatus Woesearchaeota archaeon]